MDLLFENQTQTTKKLLEEFTKETYYAFNKKNSNRVFNYVHCRIFCFHTGVYLFWF